jgi:hypothetical protein
MQPVKERPILFSGPMVRAILDGSKTQTRRVAKHPLAQAAVRINSYKGQSEFDCIFSDNTGGIICCPHGTPGDRLWVRETFAQGVEGCPGGISYRADHFDPKGDGPAHPMKWRPSIFMPRAASRILLEITDVRVQRLQEISDEDARAEGYDRSHAFPREWFALLWERIHGPGSWHANPWVWTITFRRLAPCSS